MKQDYVVVSKCILTPLKTKMFLRLANWLGAVQIHPAQDWDLEMEGGPKEQTVLSGMSSSSLNPALIILSAPKTPENKQEKTSEELLLTAVMTLILLTSTRTSSKK